MAFLVFLGQNMIRNPQIAIFLCQLDLDGQFEAFRKSLAFDTAEWRRHRRFFPTGQQVWIATVEIFICFVSKCDSIIKVWCKQTVRHHSRRILLCFEVISTTFGVPPHPNKSKIGRQMVKRDQKMDFLVFFGQNMIRNPQIAIFLCQLDLDGQFEAFCKSLALYTAEWGVYPPFLFHRSTSQNRDCRDFYFQIWLQNQSLIWTIC